MNPVLRVGNASGFYGDRLSAVREMLEGGELDVLTGDYLAELTMLILGRDQLKDPSLGYARTFLTQMRTDLALARQRGVAVVVNAGGLNPAGLATALRDLDPQARVARVEGDDLRTRAGELGLSDPVLGDPLTANAYLGCWGIAAALQAGAEVVVAGRVTDASLVVGAAAAHFGWGREDYDALAGATVAGHVLECGTHATGGNYCFLDEVGDEMPGFPLAEIGADGVSVVTKHPGSGGLVSPGTVTAQLLYEIAGPRYAGPDVVARFDTITLSPDGADRVRISGVRGEPPPPTLKVGLNYLGGFRNQAELVLTGLDIEAKAARVRAHLSSALPDLEPEWTLARTDHDDADTEETASALLRCHVKGSDAESVGRRFSRAVVELALGSYPGFHLTGLPGDASPFGVFSAAYVDQDAVEHVAVLPDGARVVVDPPKRTESLSAVEAPALPEALPAGPTRRAPLGRVVGARSGDKGGDANLGLWVRAGAGDDAGEQAWRWLAHFVTADRVRALLPEAADLPVTVHPLPNLRAVNVVIEGLLGDGVAASTRFDPQAKALGEWFRARWADIPEVVLP
ncbi:MAG TPA: acyclic terpene utilization AtuA family protein [Nocardioidaceae bacterium]|nr:acyclic terpene utilization AtuA family protein [Nocardioidaceae bacterium]